MATKKNKINLKQLLPVVLVSVGIFWLGWAIGSGHISRDSIFKRPVSKNLPKNLNYSSVEQVYDALKEQYDGQLDEEKLLDGLKKGLAGATGDPYTEYLNSKESQDFSNDLDGCFTGVGAQLGKQDDNIVIIAPISGTPADKAGVKAQDIVVEVNGESTNGLSIGEAVDRIRGDAGTTVKLKVIRNKSEEKDIEITRERVCVPSVESKILEGNIGYMKITNFNSSTAEQARKAADSFRQANVKGIVLDLRDNPGGLLDASVDVSGLWLNNKIVLLEKRGNETIKTLRSGKNPVLEGIPTVVLINEGSASASEITAGALKDNGAARIIGVTSFGKGSVQQIVKLPSGGELKVTIARWYTPNNMNIDKEGIQPDEKIEFTEADSQAGKDPQLQAAEAYLNK